MTGLMERRIREVLDRATGMGDRKQVSRGRLAQAIREVAGMHPTTIDNYLQTMARWGFIEYVDMSGSTCNVLAVRGDDGVWRGRTQNY